MAEVRCPTPGCGKLLAEDLDGRLVIWCRYCKVRHTVVKEGTYVVARAHVAGALETRSIGYGSAHDDRRPR